ncbi:hypothetical protein, partial [Exiguobacterium sp.]
MRITQYSDYGLRTL